MARSIIDDPVDPVDQNPGEVPNYVPGTPVPTSKPFPSWAISAIAFGSFAAIAVAIYFLAR